MTSITHIMNSNMMFEILPLNAKLFVEKQINVDSLLMILKTSIVGSKQVRKVDDKMHMVAFLEKRLVISQVSKYIVLNGALFNVIRE